ncbi:MAG: sulfotransferase [Chloroflexota bacterium]
MLPNFLVIGAPKAGTTSLFYYLDQHPEVYMCPMKEVGFFWAYGGFQPKGPGNERLRNRVISDQARYEALFQGVKDEKAIGEASVRYLASPNSPELIRRFIPGAKLIVSLRQPADRAFSAFVHNLTDGVEPCTDFAEALEQEKQGQREGWTQARYFQNGRYATSLKRYLEYFDRGQLHISLFEDLRDEPLSLMSDIYTFLGVRADFKPDTTHRYNVSGLIRNPLLRVLWARLSKLRAAVRPFFSPRARYQVAEWVMQDTVKPKFSPELRVELTEYYRDEIEQLQELLQRDLSAWLK